MDKLPWYVCLPSFTKFSVLHWQLIAGGQLCSLELLETILSVGSSHRSFFWIEPIAELSRRLLCVQKDLGFEYLPKLSSAILSLFVILVQTELEHEHLSILKLLHFLLTWKYGNGMRTNFCPEDNCSLALAFWFCFLKEENSKKNSNTHLFC